MSCQGFTAYTLKEPGQVQSAKPLMPIAGQHQRLTNPFVEVNANNIPDFFFLCLTARTTATTGVCLWQCSFARIWGGTATSSAHYFYSFSWPWVIRTATRRPRFFFIFFEFSCIFFINIEIILLIDDHYVFIPTLATYQGKHRAFHI